MTNHLTQPMEQIKSRHAPLTIYYVWNYLEWGGVQIYFLSLMRTVSQKYKVKAVLPKGSDKKILDYLEVNNIEYDFFEANTEVSKADTIVKRIKRRINDFKTNIALAKHLSRYDLKNSIVQIDVAPWSGFLLLLYLALKTNVFVTFHTALPELSFFRRVLLQTKFAFLQIFKQFHLAASNFDVKKSLRSYASAKRYEQIEVIYSSVNIAEIDRALNKTKTRDELAEKHNFPTEKIWVCNVAQFIERKGCWVFLEAIQNLKAKREDLFFLWLGTAALSEESKAAIEKYDLGDRFRYLSPDEIGSREDLLSLWKAADIFVLPSFQEGLPMSLIEAMALGKACIASNINAIPEAVEDKISGLLVSAGSSSQLENAIEILADDRHLRDKLGANAQKIVLENFEGKVIGQKMLRLYENVVGQVVTEY